MTFVFTDLAQCTDRMDRLQHKR